MPSQQPESSLEAEFAALGVSSEEAAMESDGAKALARARTTEILAKKFADRDRAKAKLVERQETSRQRAQTSRQEQKRRWRQKMQRSPFLVDLVAENERLDEEHRVRRKAEARQSRLLDQQRNALQQQVIVRALREESDLDALRREKRAIINEERRLKALLDLEKTRTRAKVDTQAAERAERQRKAAKSDLRRQRNVDALTRVRTAERDLLKDFTDAPNHPDNTFSANELSTNAAFYGAAQQPPRSAS
mmetsp:Transcript_29471/g.95004  ORF Transcript_29471/g.95004 Transcript_29471/m.95004 type:complete len:248 (+) Transcript_29471:35-778(+)